VLRETVSSLRELVIFCPRSKRFRAGLTYSARMAGNFTPIPNHSLKQAGFIYIGSRTQAIGTTEVVPFPDLLH